MNKNLDLVKILINCPIGTKFNSSLYGDVKFKGILFGGTSADITVELNDESLLYYTKRGIPKGIPYPEVAGCDLFPSETQRDWFEFETSVNVKKFNPKEFKPFDKVLTRKNGSSVWHTNRFEYVNDFGDIVCYSGYVLQCIPYNKETKDLLGTSNDCPEHYKYWEK